MSGSAPILMLLALAGLQAPSPGSGPGAPDAPPPPGPRVVVLGTAQDAGLPQIACEEEPCRRARAAPLRVEGGRVQGIERLPASLLLVDPRTERRYLLEATPALSRQVDLARDLGHLPRPDRAPAAPRPALFDGIFLTHAHMGHYAGLLQLGREAHGGAPCPVHASPRMLEFLQGNGPWSLLFEAGHLVASPLVPASGKGGAAPLALGPVELGPDLRVRAFPVPHRDEFSDTLAFVVEGPGRSLLFLPDIDKWERLATWPGGARTLTELLDEVDHALVDGTFFADGEVPGRAMDEIPHPFVEETLRLVEDLPLAERRKLVFLHLNHTNPLCLPDHPAHERVRAAGCRVAREGDVFELGTR